MVSYILCMQLNVLVFCKTNLEERQKKRWEGMMLVVVIISR